MEPIFKNLNFSRLLRVWNFIISYYDYLGMNELVAKISLYQLSEHIESDKKTKFIHELIKSLVLKLSLTAEMAKRHKTSSLIVKSSRYQIFEKLVDCSSFEIAIEQINFILSLKNIPLLPQANSFEDLQTEGRYIFLAMLINLVKQSSTFSEICLKKLKADFTVYNQKVKQTKQRSIEFETKYHQKMTPFQILGIDKNERIYYYFRAIPNQILYSEPKEKTWNSIQQKSGVKQKVVEMIQQADSLNINETFLMGSLCQVYDKIKESSEDIFAFNTDNKLYSLNDSIDSQMQIKSRFQNLKQSLKKMEYEYSNFQSNCFNYRWASKNTRNQFYNQIDAADSIQALCFLIEDFYKKTKFTSQRNIKTLEYYDIDLATQDVSQDNFKTVHFKTSFVYNHGAFTDDNQGQKNSINLNDLMKVYSQRFEFGTGLFSHAFIFVETAINIIKQIYNTNYQKRLRYLQNSSKQIKKAEQRQNNKNKYKNKNKNQKQNQNPVLSKFGRLSVSSSKQSAQNEEGSQKTVNKAHKQVFGRGRRNRAKIFYGQVNKNSTKKEKGRQSKKMCLDSDEQSDYTSSESATINDEGINLDGFSYQQSNPVGRILRARR